MTAISKFNEPSIFLLHVYYMFRMCMKSRHLVLITYSIYNSFNNMHPTKYVSWCQWHLCCSIDSQFWIDGGCPRYCVERTGNCCNWFLKIWRLRCIHFYYYRNFVQPLTIVIPIPPVAFRQVPVRYWYQQCTMKYGNKKNNTKLV